MKPLSAPDTGDYNVSSISLYISELSDTSACRVSLENIDSSRTRNAAIEVRVITSAELREKFSIVKCVL